MPKKKRHWKRDKHGFIMFTTVANEIELQKDFWEEYSSYFTVPKAVEEATQRLVDRFPDKSGIYRIHLLVPDWDYHNGRRPNDTPEKAIDVGLHFSVHGRNSNRHIYLEVHLDNPEHVIDRRNRTSGCGDWKVPIEGTEEVGTLLIDDYDAVAALEWINDTIDEFTLAEKQFLESLEDYDCDRYISSGKA